MTTAIERITSIGTSVSICAAALAVLNALTIERLQSGAENENSGDVLEHLTVCIPARNECTNLPLLLRDLTEQVRCPTMRVLVYDDSSTDGTGAAARTFIGTGLDLRVIDGLLDPPDGWTGKAAACRHLAAIARQDYPNSATGIMLFLDADVRLKPWVVAAAVGRLRQRGVSMLSPWPYQSAVTLAEQIVQPLLCWSWMTTVPVWLSNRLLAPSLVVACGQFLMFDAHDYFRIGGHSAVAASATEDLDIARAMRQAGRRTAIVAAGDGVECRMYGGPKHLFVGYTRWLWSVSGGCIGSGLLSTAVLAVYVLPPYAAVFGSGRTQQWGVHGAIAGAVSRYVVRRSEGSIESRFHDVCLSAAHPASALAFVVLSTSSSIQKKRGRLSWKDRPLLGSDGDGIRATRLWPRPIPDS